MRRTAGAGARQRAGRGMNICLAVVIVLAFCGVMSWALETEARWKWESQDRKEDGDEGQVD